MHKNNPREKSCPGSYIGTRSCSAFYCLTRSWRGSKLGSLNWTLISSTESQFAILFEIPMFNRILERILIMDRVRTGILKLDIRISNRIPVWDPIYDPGINKILKWILCRILQNQDPHPEKDSNFRFYSGLMF